MGWKTKASSGGGNFEPCPAGNHSAVLIGIIDLGTQSEVYQGQKREAHKIFLAWEIPGEQKEDGTNHVIGREYTYSFHEKAGLRKMIEAWRNKKFGEGEEFDIGKLLGQACLLTVMSDTKGDKTYSRIDGASALPKGMAKPSSTIKPISFNLEDDSLDSFPEQDWLPWSYGRALKSIAELSPEWKEKSGKPAKPKADSDPEPNDTSDDVPF